MKQTLGRFLLQPNKDFPLDCETLDCMQSNIAAISILGNIAGDKAILLGCELEQNNTRRKAGYLFLRTLDYPDGEVIYWQGGNVSSGMYLKQEVISVSAQGYDYPEAYVARSLAAGIGNENYNWNDFKTIKTNQQLDDQSQSQDAEIEKLTPLPLGIVQMWAGSIGSIPVNYRLCDGSSLTVAEYPALYAALGITHGGMSGYSFNLPDLRGRFIAGYSANDADYNTMAKSGGAKMVTLTASQSGMPEHSHLFKWTGFKSAGGSKGEDRIARGSGDASSEEKATETCPASNAAASHENRPPYYTLAYIMRVK